MAMTTQNYSDYFKDMMGAFPVDTKAWEDAFKTQSTLTEKLSDVSLEAARRTTDLGAKWFQDTYDRFSTVTAAKDDPADYMKAMTDFASSWSEAVTEQMAAYAEVTRKAQSDAMDLMLAAGRDTSADVTTAARKATSDLSTAAQQTASAATR